MAQLFIVSKVSTKKQFIDIEVHILENLFHLLFIFIVIFVVTAMVLNTETKCLLLGMVWTLTRQLLMGAD